MAVRQTGFALLSSASVQEAHDLALVAQAATLRTRVPFVHFFDGFRTSHELNTIELIDDDVLRAVVPEHLVREHRARALTPEHPFVRGTAQNPDVYFQARETVNPFYAGSPGVVQEVMDEVAAHTGRAYRVAEYSGHPEAERVVVVMGSGGETVRETVTHLVGGGERVGVLQLRLYRPFPAAELLAALPDERAAGRRPRPHQGAGLQRRAALPRRRRHPRRGPRARRPRHRPAGHRRPLRPVVQGADPRRWSPASSPSSALARAAPPVHPRHHRRRRRHEPALRPRPRHRGPADPARGLLRARLGRHGRRQQEHDQDPRRRPRRARAGLLRLRLQEVRRPHRLAPALRSAPDPRALPREPGRLRRAATTSDCSTPSTCSPAPRTGRRCCSTPRSRPTRSGTRSPARCSRRSSTSGCACMPSTPTTVARVAGLPGSHQHRAADLLLRHLRRAARARRRSPGSRRRSARPTAVGAPRWCGATRPPSTPRSRRCTRCRSPAPGRRSASCPTSCPRDAPEFVRTVTAEMMAGRGDALPVSAMPVDGTYPSGTTAYEKRRISDVVADWDPDTCIQCGTCSFVCPHSVIRSKFFDEGGARRRAGRVPLGAAQRGRAARTRATRCRSTSRTARAAACASRPAR